MKGFSRLLSNSTTGRHLLFLPFKPNLSHHSRHVLQNVSMTFKIRTLYRPVFELRHSMPNFASNRLIMWVRLGLEAVSPEHFRTAWDPSFVATLDNGLSSGEER